MRKGCEACERLALRGAGHVSTLPQRQNCHAQAFAKQTRQRKLAKTRRMVANSSFPPAQACSRRWLRAARAIATEWASVAKKNCGRLRRLSGFRLLGADRPRRRRGGYKYRAAARLLWHDFAPFSRLCALSSSHRPSHHHPLHRSSERGALRFHSDFRLSEHFEGFFPPLSVHSGEAEKRDSPEQG